MSQTHDQQHFTISEMAADWHELMALQRFVRPYIARALSKDSWTSGEAITNTPQP